MPSEDNADSFHGMSSERLYEQGVSDRRKFLDRAKDCARLTIPSMYTEPGVQSSEDHETPYQSIGARGVNHLAAKIMLALFPPNEPNFRVSIHDYALAEITADGEDSRAQVEEHLQKFERKVAQAIEEDGNRNRILTVLKHLIVIGNRLVFIPEKGKLKTYGLHQYINKRDASGNHLYTVLKQTVALRMLAKDVQDWVREEFHDEYSGTYSEVCEKPVDVYTRIWVDDTGERVRSHEEIRGMIVEGSAGSWPKDKSPWRVQGWNWLDGEDYARSFVEDLIADLNNFDALQQLMTEGSTQSGRVLYFVRNGSMTKMEDVAKAENGEVLKGNADDVTVLQVGKFADFRTVNEHMESLKRDLQLVFLLNTAVQRSGERVTAEEIRYMAQELESSLGGIYSFLSQELLQPIIERKIDALEISKEVPKLPKDFTSLTITVGLDALRRGQDAEKLDRFMARVGKNPEAARHVNWGDYVKRLAVAEGIDPSGLVKSPEQIQAEQQAIQQQQQQAQMMELAGKAAGPLAKGGADAIAQAAADAQDQPQ